MTHTYSSNTGSYSSNTQYSTALDIALASNPQGESKIELLAALTGQWGIQDEVYAGSPYIISLCLSTIAGKQLRNRIMSGTVTKVGRGGYNVTYAVIYHRTTPELCFMSQMVACSYRETKLGNFVLVRPVQLVGSGVGKVTDNQCRGK
jgi:hypothetical protein